MKKWYQSKSIWAQVVAFVVTLTSLFGLELNFSPEQQAALVGGIHALVGIGMRFITNSPISK